MVDVDRLREILRTVAAQKPLEICIEKQYSRKNQGLKSSGTTMFNYGELVATAHEFVSPICCTAQAWQKQLLIPGDGDTKERSIATCQHLYPEIDLRPTPRCQPSHGFSDAVLIATHLHNILEEAA